MHGITFFLPQLLRKDMLGTISSGFSAVFSQVKWEVKRRLCLNSSGFQASCVIPYFQPGGLPEHSTETVNLSLAHLSSHLDCLLGPCI